MMAPILLFVGFIMIAIIARVIADGWDRDRIRRYIAERGGATSQIEWQLFGPGWYGDKNRIYNVAYYDAQGNQHAAVVKTSALAGVYFTEDYISRPVATPSPIPPQPALPVHDELESLRQENRRLRDELDRLRQHRS